MIHIIRFSALLAAAALAFLGLLVATDPADNLVVVGNELVTLPSGGRVVQGRVENRTDRTYTQVQARIVLFDAEGKEVERACAETAAVTAGATWRFDARVSAGEPVATRVTVSSPDNIRPGWLSGPAPALPDACVER